jgi:hypothetical protein
MAIPFEPGPLEVTVAVNYLDDFNRPQQFIRTLTVDVMESGGGGGGGGVFPDGEIPIEPTMPTDETFLQTLWRAVLGLLGFDSAPAQPAGEPGIFEEIQPEPVPPIIMPPAKG